MKCTNKYYNADASGTWNLTPSKEVHVLGYNKKCKVIVLHKEIVGNKNVDTHDIISAVRLWNYQGGGNQKLKPVLHPSLL